jgi:16S rRNA (guanine966-N2)-methyltransferase
LIQNSFRISSGLFKGLKFKFPSSEGLRPTKSIVKETLFNWLQFAIPGSKVLDLFSGSGSLAFEAISREAISVTIVEKDKTVFDSLKKNSNFLKENLVSSFELKKNKKSGDVYYSLVEIL